MFKTSILNSLRRNKLVNTHFLNIRCAHDVEKIEISFKIILSNFKKSKEILRKFLEFISKFSKIMRFLVEFTPTASQKKSPGIISIRSCNFCLINLPLAVFFYKAAGIYFDKSSIVTHHLYHRSERIDFGNPEVCSVVENMKSF